MAENDTHINKSERAKKEEEILKFWKENNIFEKSLKKPSPKGDFVFYEGPPTANGKPGIHHLEARAFKDAIPRFKTMQGYHVRRKGGWDTHGLPVEIAVEKELGLKSKKEIESYGIEKFNQKCKESVWKYVDEWEHFTNRIGYWVDQDNPYITYHTNYIESVWNIIKKIYDDGRIYKDYRVVPWCPRCGTALSSHELAQGYETLKDLSVVVEFRVKGKNNTSLLAWTTTPWTLPGNVALAVHPDISYVEIEKKDMGEGNLVKFILAKDKLNDIFGDDDYEIVKEVKGRDLAGMEYEPLYDFISSKKDLKHIENAWKVYPADFVTTEEGTGIVHIAPMYGQDDFELGKKVGLPKYHLVKEDGHFLDNLGDLSGRFVKDEDTAVAIIKDLAHRNLLFKKEKHEHSYPHCWRCKTPLIYYARDSWYIRMSSLSEELVKENQKINWEPKYIKDGRFGEWLREVKDWAISRERYWGTPLPVWECVSCNKKTAIGSLDELKQKTKDALTKIIVVRHAESIKNTKNIFDSTPDALPLTRKGEKVAQEAGKKLKKERVDHLYFSPVRRTRETAEIINKELRTKTTSDDDLAEIYSGKWEGKSVNDKDLQEERKEYLSALSEERYVSKRGGIGESWEDLDKRTEKFLKKIIDRHKGETVVVVTHRGNLIYIARHLEKLTSKSVEALFNKEEYGSYSRPFSFYVDTQRKEGVDLHRPYVDSFVLSCECGKDMRRTPEVMDVWFDSGAMPFAQDHYPFDDDYKIQPKSGFFKKQKGYPADFISEAIDQTRGWFYTLHAIGVLLGYGIAYKNVISLGHILDEKGKKMSKSVGNVVDPWEMTHKYGSDALRFWMYSVNQPGDAKNFDEKTVDEIVKKVFNLLLNTVHFYELYKDEKYTTEIVERKNKHILDEWILSRLAELVESATNCLNNYQLFVPTREIREFMGDLSQWYIRRSRNRFKNDNEKREALITIRFVLSTLSRVIAPFIPFVAEEVYQAIKEANGPESVHLSEWPLLKDIDKIVLEKMKTTRNIVSEGLLCRSEAKIKVRQPLSFVSIKYDLGKEYNELIKDELNVKDVLVNINQEVGVIIDTVITQELKDEGHIREFMRNIQDLRKDEKCTPSDSIILFVSSGSREEDLIKKYEDNIKRATKTREILFQENEGKNFEDGELRYRLYLKK